jgi:hypothetical protein
LPTCERPEVGREANGIRGFAPLSTEAVGSHRRQRPQLLVGLPNSIGAADNVPMGGRSRQRIFGDRVRGARIGARHARRQAENAVREADAAECLLWSEQMEGFGGPAQPSPTIAQCLNGGYGWLEVMCHRCETRASLPLDAIRRPRDTPVWKLEAALRCRACKTSCYAPPVHMIRLTKERKIAPYPWVHPDDDR